VTVVVRTDWRTSADRAATRPGSRGGRGTLSGRSGTTVNIETRVPRSDQSGQHPVRSPLQRIVPGMHTSGTSAMQRLFKSERRRGNGLTRRKIRLLATPGERSIQNAIVSAPLVIGHASAQQSLNTWITHWSSNETDGCATSAAKPWTCRSRSTTRCPSRSTTSYPSQREAHIRWSTSSWRTSAATPERGRGN
jgi:hypothetical protein